MDKAFFTRSKFDKSPKVHKAGYHTVKHAPRFGIIGDRPDHGNGLFCGLRIRRGNKDMSSGTVFDDINITFAFICDPLDIFSS